MKPAVVQIIQTILVCVLAFGGLVGYTEAKFASKETSKTEFKAINRRLDNVEITLSKIYDHLLDP